MDGLGLGKPRQAMAITRDEVIYTAKLARLELTEDELERFGRDLARISAHVDQLAELRDTAAETAPVLPLVRDAESFREDVVQPSLTQAAALAGAPDPSDGFFRVPKVIG